MYKSIFLVEDNDGDAMLIEEAFKALGHTTTVLERARNGEDAVERLAYDNQRTPDLVLLDLNMPRMNGFEVLEKVRMERGDKTTQIVVLSTSDLPRDIRRALELEANAYVTKAFGFDELLVQIENIDRFWLQTAKRA